MTLFKHIFSFFFVRGPPVKENKEMYENNRAVQKRILIFFLLQNNSFKPGRVNSFVYIKYILGQ
jgi:hypothetical protein